MAASGPDTPRLWAHSLRPGGWCVPVLTTSCDIPADGFVEELPPESYRRLLSGHLERNHRGLYLEFTFSQLPLRRRHLWRFASGLQAKLLLETVLPPGDYDMLQELLELYPGHKLEFTCWDHPVGIYHRQTCLWEVRAY